MVKKKPLKIEVLDMLALTTSWMEALLNELKGQTFWQLAQPPALMYFQP